MREQVRHPLMNSAVTLHMICLTRIIYSYSLKVEIPPSFLVFLRF